MSWKAYVGPLKGSPNIFKTKRHLLVCKRTPGTDKVSLMLIFRTDSNLIISGETVHEGENLITGTLVNYLIDKWCGVIIFRTCFIKVSEINANSKFSLFFIYGNRV